MTRDTVINQLSIELATLCEAETHLNTIRRYIDMAIDVGTIHFSLSPEEIIALDKNGREVDRFKSSFEAAEKLGIESSNIRSVLCGIRHSAGGFIFIKRKDFEKLRRKAG